MASVKGNTLVKATAGLLVLVAIGFGGFFSARSLTGGAGGEEPGAEPPGPTAEQPELTKGLEPILEEEAKPPFIGDKLGIFIMPADPQIAVTVPPEYVTYDRLCGPNPDYQVLPWDQAGELDFTLQLPPEVVFLPNDPDSGVFACNGAVIGVKRAYDYGGGRLIVARNRTTVYDGIRASAERVKVISIGGRQAVLIEPVTPVGTELGGQTAIIFPEPFGKTFVFTFDVPLTDALKVAEIVAQATR